MKRRHHYQQQGVDETNVLVDVDQMTDLPLNSGASSSFAHEEPSSGDAFHSLGGRWNAVRSSSEVAGVVTHKLTDKPVRLMERCKRSAAQRLEAMAAALEHAGEQEKAAVLRGAASKAAARL